MTATAFTDHCGNSAGVRMVDLIFRLVFGTLALWVVICQGALLIGLTFHQLTRVFSVLAPLAALGVVAVVYRNRQRRLTVHEGRDYPALLMLVLLTATSALYSLAALRPDPDDVNYVSRIVFFLANRQVPLDLAYHDHALTGLDFTNPALFAYTGEFFQGYFAALLSLPFLDIYHVMAPALGGALIPLAWFLLLSRFTGSQRTAVLAAGIVCAYLVLDGDTHRAFGNFAFVRIWQGKSLLMSVITPVFVAYSIDFFFSRSRAAWFMLLILNIAAAGLTSMSFFFMPLLGILLGMGFTFTQTRAFGATVGILATYYAAYFYLVAGAVYFLLKINLKGLEYVGFETGYPETFTGQFKLVFDGYTGYVSLMAMTFIALATILQRPVQRRFLLGWLVAGILLLNPLAFPVVAEHVTTPNAYWRLFYILPYPLAIGLVVTGIQRLAHPDKKWRYALIASAVFLFTAIKLVSGSDTTFSRLPFALGSYKLDPGLAAAAQRILQVSHPGAMLSPQSYSRIIPILSSDYPQVSVRDFTLMSLAISAGSRDLADSRLRAVRYISGEKVDGLADLTELLDLGLATVVIDPARVTQADWGALQAILTGHGLLLALHTTDYLVYTRPPEFDDARQLHLRHDRGAAGRGRSD